MRQPIPSVLRLAPARGLVLACGLALVGCDKSKPEAKVEPPPAAERAAIPAGFVLASVPADARDVAAVKAAGVKDGDEVVVRGVVGGAERPFDAARAVVQIIDPAVQTCDKMGMGKEACSTPWDACCHQDDAKARGATVRVVDAAGTPLAGTLEGVGGLKPLREIVVKGKARTGGGKSLVVDATNVWVKG